MEQTCTVTKPASELLDLDDLASLLKISPRSVYRLTDARQIPPALKIGRLNRWRRADIESWIAAGMPRS